jgi:hypothetical protein
VRRLSHTHLAGEVTTTRERQGTTDEEGHTTANSTLEPSTAQNSALVLVDYQPTMFRGVGSGEHPDPATERVDPPDQGAPGRAA